ncbi:BlaI transcriptional regulatory family [Klenkia terrae]|jgi:predicted transcriptional regulator|nr:BlaI/MecI/CopY family transcriptional regulator [Klenkia terrae]SSC22221.1 BlaI transcriptional regulatory family [Klenkia terrae]
MPRLGKLEAAVMDVLWSSHPPLTVREVLERLPSHRTLAYTTVMTVLSHLHGKGVVHREPTGKAYRYSPSLTREEAATASLREVLDASGDPQSVLLHFAETASEEESSVLRKALARRASQS